MAIKASLLGSPARLRHSWPRPSLPSRNSFEVGTHKCDGLTTTTNWPGPTKPYKKRLNSPVTFRYWHFTELPATALVTADTLRLDRVSATAAPTPLPGVAVSPLLAVTLGSGQTAFSTPITLSLPYPDAEHDGVVDATSPSLPALALTAWRFDTARQRWVLLPEAHVFPAFTVLRVATAQTGLYGVFQAVDGSMGLAGTSAPASPPPLSTGAQGSGWQDIGVVTTFPFLVPLNTTPLPNGTYAVRAVCSTQLADLAAVQEAPASSAAGRSASASGGGGCSLRPGDAWSRATALAALGNIGLPLVVLLILGLWAWRRRRATGV